MSIISQEPKPGLSMHHVHPSKISPLAPANITKETGQGKEYLQNSSITTTHMGFNAPVAPTNHLSHGGASRQPDSPTTSPTNHHMSHNKAYV
jgi:hypothetical protein